MTAQELQALNDLDIVLSIEREGYCRILGYKHSIQPGVGQRTIAILNWKDAAQYQNHEIRRYLKLHATN